MAEKLLQFLTKLVLKPQGVTMGNKVTVSGESSHLLSQDLESDSLKKYKKKRLKIFKKC